MLPLEFLFQMVFLILEWVHRKITADFPPCSVLATEMKPGLCLKMYTVACLWSLGGIGLEFFPSCLGLECSLNLFCKKCDWRYNLKPSLHECFRRKWTLPKGNTDKYLFTKMREIMEIIWQQKFSQCGLEVRYNISLLTEWLFLRFSGS